MLISVVAGWAWVQLITAKPVVYLVNLTKKDYMRKKNKWLPKIAAWIKENGGEPMIPYSVNLEQVGVTLYSTLATFSATIFAGWGRMWTGANSRTLLRSCYRMRLAGCTEARHAESPCSFFVERRSRNEFCIICHAFRSAGRGRR